MSIPEMKKEIHLLVEEINDEALLQEIIDFFKQDEEDSGATWDELPEEEKKEMLDSADRIDRGVEETYSLKEAKEKLKKWSPEK